MREGEGGGGGEEGCADRGERDGRERRDLGDGERWRMDGVRTFIIL